MFIYRITARHQIQNAWPLLIFLVIAICFPFYMVLKFGREEILTYLLIALCFFLIFFIPVLLVHLNYYKINKHDVVSYDPMISKFIIYRDGLLNIVNLDDIELIERHSSYPLAENRNHYFPWDGYNHSIIRLKNGRTFVITSLLIPNLDLLVGKERMKVKKSFYRLVTL